MVTDQHEDDATIDVDDDPAIPDDEGTPGTAITRRRTSKTARLVEAQRILEDHLRGIPDVYLCQKYRVSRATLYRRIAEARDFVLDPTVEQYRTEAVARLNAARSRVFDALAATGEPAAVAQLTASLVRIEDTEAKLRGGYAPTTVKHEHRVASAFDTLLAELDQRPAPTAEERAR